MNQYSKGEWIRTSHLGAVEITGFNDMGIIVAWDHGGMGRRVIAWAQAEKENPEGSVKGDLISDNEIL